MCFPSPGLRHNDKLKVILRQHYCIIGCFFGENIFLYIGRGHNNSLDNLKYKTVVCKKNSSDVFVFVCLFFFTG